MRSVKGATTYSGSAHQARGTRPWPEGFGSLQQGEVLRLHLRNLYIVPTRFGGLWLAGAVLLQVVGIQTQRNGPLLLSFLLLALLLLAMHLTHANLQGLELRCGNPGAGFADTPLAYPLVLHSDSSREGIELRLTGGPLSAPQRLKAGANPLLLDWRCQRRGAQRPGPLLIRSTAPLGLFVCWSRWQPPAFQLVVPARRRGPVGLAPIPPSRPQSGRAAAGRGEGIDHWHDLRPQRPEDSQSRLAWKALAQGRGRLTKLFRTEGDQPPTLTLDATVPHEQALEHLSAAVWQRSQAGERFGLLLPDQRIPPDQGKEHRERCLQALALSR
jgi:uncharacterized protein (DUF58 family)